jgi:peptidoglycan/LPS O-acetylase OafA/YrhL
MALVRSSQPPGQLTISSNTQLEPQVSPHPAGRQAVTYPSTTERPTRATPPAKSEPKGGRRLAWLDALRGIAALCVVFSHLTPYVLVNMHNAVYEVFDPGLYGVLVFFLVSGYIVPASLERKGSIRTFWLSRLFRLFPLFVVAVAAALLLHSLGYASLRGTSNNPTGSIFAHLFMLGDLLGGQDVIVVLWTLSYEMVFYLLLTALFTVGLHRRSGRLAAAFAGGALLLGGVLPTFWLDHSGLGLTNVAIGADILVIGGVALAVAGNKLSRTVGAWLAAATGLALLMLNERVYAYEGLTILTVMFTGTLLYRAEQGQISLRRAIPLAVGIFGALIAAGLWHIPAFSTTGDAATQQRQWVISVALAGLTFAVGMVLRRMRVPSFLAWLGLVSYSVYLLHPLLIDIYGSIPWTSGSHPLATQVALASGFFAAMLALCAVTYYFVEAPMQRLGRRIAARLDARFGPDHLTATGMPAA